MKHISSRIFAIIFIISQFYWVYWIGVGIKNFIFGMNGGWLIPVRTEPTIWGVETIDDSFAMALLLTVCTPFIIIPIYQVIYLLVVIVKRIKKKKG